MAMEWKEMGIREKGFTLIEVMIALSIFLIGVLSIIGMLIIGGKGITGGHKSFNAVQAAKSQMELLRGSIVPDALSDVCPALSAPTIQCVWSVRKGVPAEGISTLQVITTWYEGERNRKLVLTLLRFDGDE